MLPTKKTENSEPIHFDINENKSEGSPQSASTHSSVNEDTHREQRIDPICRIHGCNKPNQPDNSYAFPNSGNSHSRSFQSHWFKSYN